MPALPRNSSSTSVWSPGSGPLAAFSLPVRSRAISGASRLERGLVGVGQPREVRAHDLRLGAGLADLVRVVRPAGVVVHEAEQHQAEVGPVVLVVEAFALGPPVHPRDTVLIGGVGGTV